MERKTQENEQKDSIVANTACCVTSGAVAANTAETTVAFNKECAAYREALSARNQAQQAALDLKLASDPSYLGDRQKGVDTAYRYEIADVKMGGRGSANWTDSERAELLQHGRVRGAEGHHINSVHDNPRLQANADNIQFMRSHKEHLQKGHKGKFANPSSGTPINKDKMLQHTNFKRVAVNEVKGVACAAGAGAVIGLGKSVWRSCRENGWSFKSVKRGFKESKSEVASSAAVATFGYVFARVCSLF